MWPFREQRYSPVRRWAPGDAKTPKIERGEFFMKNICLLIAAFVAGFCTAMLAILGVHQRSSAASWYQDLRINSLFKDVSSYCKIYRV